MPRGSGHPDLSQRPRREAPGMLTSIAILERELGSNDYTRHMLHRRLAQASDEDAATLTQQIAELEARREAVLELLESVHADKRARHPDAGRAARARPARRR